MCTNVLEYITIKLNTMDIKNNSIACFLKIHNIYKLYFLLNCTPGRRAVFDVRTNMKHRTVSEILSSVSTEDR
jgi:hypothetical protein